MTRGDEEPIAVIGAGCRFPRIRGVREFWRALCDGVDVVGPIGAERYGLRPLAQPDDGNGGPAPAARMGSLDDISAFDAGFFGIGRRQAAHMDPQQRLMVETTWEAFEDAGIVPGSPAAHATGVFAAQTASHYWHLLARDGLLDMYGVLGAGTHAGLSGQLSFQLDLRGPSMTVDTNCSGGLAAVHLARKSLHAGECGLAVAGAVQLVLSPEEHLAYGRAGVLSARGRCAFADAEADGFVRGEGCAVVVLKPLSAALRDGDRVYAALLGSAMTNDGRQSPTVLGPARAAQEEALRRAYDDAGVDPSRVSFVEAHGVGTPVGDPVEITALASVLGPGRRPDHPLLVGSVRGNLGHQEPVAGLTGLIKAALALHHRVLPATLHHTTPNPAVPWDRLPCSVVSEPTALPRHGAPVAAGVNSLSVSGTNVHAVLGSVDGPPDDGTPDGPLVLVLSARHPDSLDALIDAHADFLETSPEVAMADSCHTAAVRRAHHPYRRVFRAGDRAEMVEALRHRPRAVHAAASPAPPEVVLVLHDGHADRACIEELSRRSNTFRDAVQQAEAALRCLPGTPPFDPAMVPDTMSWLLAMGLTALWRDWGVPARTVRASGSGSVVDPDRPVLHFDRTGVSSSDTTEGDHAVYDSLVDAAARLHEIGHDVRWERILPPGRPVSLPPYPWRKDRYWAPTTGGPAEQAHPLLPDHATEERTVRWRATPHPAGSPLTPGGLVELAAAVAHRLCGSAPATLRQLRVMHRAALRQVSAVPKPALRHDGALEATGLAARPGRWRFTVTEAPGVATERSGPPRRLAEGFARRSRQRDAQELLAELRPLRQLGLIPVTDDDAVAWHAGTAAELESRGVRGLVRHGNAVLLRLAAPPPGEVDFRFPPDLLDLLLEVASGSAPEVPGDVLDIERATVTGRWTSLMWGLVSCPPDGPADIRVCDDEGAVLVGLGGVRRASSPVRVDVR
ncbi:beta-ketoacyl synthase N-terminal-like domain-containing protein [Actinosynnema sp. CS-041913]|uniref:beta-ketoacyl synthase N-terminal-like domain-containing protein n=1 Tax=Actinosynnema sp. CS-041913 TaxID=3239917 RepID=UPI003D905374